jgi:predicted nuclease with RNAse H fold
MNPVFIGIDPTAGRRPMDFAVLNDDLDLLQHGQGNLDAVLELVRTQASAVVAVDAPQSPNGGLMRNPERRQSYGLRPESAKWANFKVCEYELRRRGLKLYSTPGEIQAAPKWMQLGFKLYAAMRAEGYQPYRPGSAAPKQYLEVHPHAIYATLLGHLPWRKDTLEGRMQRQLVLHRENVEVANPMAVLEEITGHHLLEGQLPLPTLCSHDELDALASAYTAYLAYRHVERVTCVGDEIEGQIVLPISAADFKERYR